jgi:hypothetical protein
VETGYFSPRNGAVRGEGAQHRIERLGAVLEIVEFRVKAHRFVIDHKDMGKIAQALEKRLPEPANPLPRHPEKPVERRVVVVAFGNSVEIAH